MLPGTTSLYVTAAFKLFIVYGPKGPKVILNSYKAFMQGQIGAHSTLEKWRGAASKQKRMQQPRTDRQTDRDMKWIYE